MKVPKEQKEALRDFLEKSLNTNSLYRINNGYDFLVEGIFRHVKNLEEYLEKLEDKFTIEQKQVYYIIEDLKREDFMNDEKLLDVVVGK